MRRMLWLFKVGYGCVLRARTDDPAISAAASGRGNPVIARRKTISALAGSVFAAAPLTSLAQAAGRKMRRIGSLAFDPPSSGSAALRDSFVAGMRDLGYVEGRDYTILRIEAGGQTERVPVAAAELVAGGVNVILTSSTRLTLAAKNATSTIPIVMFNVSDPAVTGLVASLSHPGGNVTGIAGFDTELVGKRVELLREAVPSLSRLAVLHNPDYPTTRIDLVEVETAARRFKLRLVPIELQQGRDTESAVEQAAKSRSDGSIVIGGARDSAREMAPLFASLARWHLPNVGIAGAARIGAMLSYGSSNAREIRQAASLVDKIFKGANPGDLPVEQVTKLDLIVNLKAARTIGLKIPQS